MKRHALPTIISLIALIVLILAPCPGSSFARGSYARSHVAGYFSYRYELAVCPTCQPVFADFDGDHRLDEAELHLTDSHRCIRVRFGDSRESHLDLHSDLQTPGRLVARDVNRDNKTDLIWLSTSQSTPVAIWLGDGLGHFAESINKIDVDADLPFVLLGNRDSRTVGGSNDEEQAYLAPNSVSSELPRASHLEVEDGKPIVIEGTNRRRDPGLYLSYLRERGPPLQIAVILTPIQ